MIRRANPDDAAAICAIYNPYVTGSTVTFEEQEVPVEAMAARIAEVTRDYPWLVLENEGRTVGYAYATRWRVRAAYRFSVETTIYLAAGQSGRGFGRLLYGELLRLLREQGLHLAIGGIALPNPASVALHEKLGFRKVAQFGEVGYKFGQWLDVGYWQVRL